MFIYPWGVNEDNLTGDFFGLMKFLPHSELLSPFLSLIQRQYQKQHQGCSFNCDISPHNIKDAEILLWPSYEIPLEWQTQFNNPHPKDKKRSKFYIIPDVVLLINNCVFIIEAEKSHSVEAEQLFQQYIIGKRKFLTGKKYKQIFLLLINTEQMYPYFCNIPNPISLRDICISSRDSIPEYIHKRAKMVNYALDLDKLKNSFLWISWHQIRDFCEERVEKVPKVLIGLFKGLKELMNSQGFYPARLFRADNPEEVCLEYKDIDRIPKFTDC